MKELLWLIVALPFSGALILALAGRKLSRLTSAVIGVGTVSLSAILTILLGLNYMHTNPAGQPFEQVLWHWFNVGGLSPEIAFHLDTVSLVFMFVITFVGALIHLYSTRFMWEHEGFSRFFAYMNLFIGFMLTLVLANNLLLLYLGWEGVGLCSYLLIGFWYKNSDNGYAARKAFIVTRVGDTSLAIGLFLLFMHFNTLNIQDIMNTAPSTIAGTGVAVAVALLLLGGALGKSAQLPLQTWLPDAMAGPSPVSALIHAATMVTAGVYLIARTHVLFELAPMVQSLVAAIGAATLLLSGFSALNQHDIKRVLAYSTISQIGYMFLALGVGAWSAAIFHFMVHAFFKALLFLGAGALIWALNEEHNMFKMGGLYKKMPVVFWTFLIAASALAALPFITAGYFSKDKIIWLAYASNKGSVLLWIAAVAGAFITALYTFRMVFVTFFGPSKSEPTSRPKLAMTIPMVVLALFAFGSGYIELPKFMGHVTLFSDFVDKTLPITATMHSTSTTEIVMQLIAALATLSGLFVAFRYYYNKSFPATVPQRNATQEFFYKGWDFDILYNKVIVQPVVFLSKINKKDFVDLFYKGLASAARALNVALSASQTGKVRWYAMVIAIGAILTLTILFYR